MFKKILVCNRGEIALRIIRTCRDLGIKTVQIYSKADADSRPVQLADEAVLIGPPAAARSYLHIPSIIHACLMTGAEAVHPGYGFLSQDTYFAEICRDSGITFIGPSPEVMEMMGDKSSARKLMADAGLPVPGGTEQPLVNYEEARDRAEQVGYPIILKASAGGGGRGMQVVWRREELAQALEDVRNTAQAVFKDNRVYLEKFIRSARHVEIQVMGDRHGNAVYLGERDCSIQRRQQKLIEESPSVYIDDDLRRRMGEAAVAGATAIGYESAGTMEFLVDPDKNFYFMEMNTRIQVEHPVTETVTGLDLIELMIRVASGEPLPLTQADIKPSGHAIECRINAEDPANNWAGASGTVSTFIPPGGPRVRVDTHGYSGYTVPPYYDSLLAKVIVHGKDRRDAMDIMLRALREFTVEGIKTTIPFHQQLLAHPIFRSGEYHLDFLEKYMNPDGTLAVPEAAAAD
ncbi:MAG TPA: acetyl-CoA carboxylase biotin carboxylase subunit [Thermomicrobiales bacterium]|nr:acetyl-CoA carboxylase biotin carboxylase subunit [Thermomicrobiales bacterium]